MIILLITRFFQPNVPGSSADDEGLWPLPLGKPQHNSRNTSIHLDKEQWVFGLLSGWE